MFLARPFGYLLTGAGGAVAAAKNDTIRNWADNVFDNVKGASKSSHVSDGSPEMSKILSSVQQLIQQSNRPQAPIVVHTGGSTWQGIAFKAGIGLIVVVSIGKYAGVRFSDFLFISKEKFQGAVTALQDKIANLGSRLAGVAEDVSAVHTAVDDLHDKTDAFAAHAGERFDHLDSMTERTNRGISLITRFIASALPPPSSATLPLHEEIRHFAAEIPGSDPDAPRIANGPLFAPRTSRPAITASAAEIAAAAAGENSTAGAAPRESTPPGGAVGLVSSVWGFLRGSTAPAKPPRSGRSRKPPVAAVQHQQLPTTLQTTSSVVGSSGSWTGPAPLLSPVAAVSHGTATMGARRDASRQSSPTLLGLPPPPLPAPITAPIGVNTPLPVETMTTADVDRIADALLARSALTNGATVTGLFPQPATVPTVISPSTSAPPARMSDFASSQVPTTVTPASVAAPSPWKDSALAAALSFGSTVPTAKA